MKRRTTRATLLGIFLALCSASASAEEVLKLKSGKVLHGNAHSYDEAAQTVKFTTREGVEHTLRTSDLNRISAYKLAKARADKDSGEDQIKLGNFARSIEAYAHAKRHYGLAEKADPSLKSVIDRERAENRRQAATFCMLNVRKALARKDTKGALEWLTTIVEKLPDEPQAREAASLLEEYYPPHTNAKDDRYEASHADLLANELRLGKKYYDAMIVKIQKGLSNTGSHATAKKFFEGAWRDGQRAMKELDKVQKKIVKQDPSSTELFGSYRRLVREHMVDSQSHLASLLTTRSDYQGAMAVVNQALSIDPRNRVLLTQRARIETASSNRGLHRW